jgi:hypothetical protein
VTVVDKKGTTHVLPDDPFWLLRIDVKPGGSTPLYCWMFWHWQWLVPRGAEA